MQEFLLCHRHIRVDNIVEIASNRYKSIHRPNKNLLEIIAWCHFRKNYDSQYSHLLTPIWGGGVAGFFNIASTSHQVKVAHQRILTINVKEAMKYYFIASLTPWIDCDCPDTFSLFIHSCFTIPSGSFGLLGWHLKVQDFKIV